jgi:hypothetical protein
MQLKLRTILLTSALLFGLVGFAKLRDKKDNPVEASNKVAEYKAKSREKIKPYRYDGSKINHFNYLTFEQKKTVEVLLFNGIDYKFCFNTDGVPKSIDIKIYDKESIEKDRILLFEANGVMSKDVLVTSSEMLKNLQAKKTATALKKIFIEYHVPVGDKVVEANKIPAPDAKKEKDNAAAGTNPTEKGVVVVSYGYKNS